MNASTGKPSLKVIGLHIEGLRALRRVDWPADGMGWDGKVPDLVMVGGINGSGKTTLLEFIGDAARVLKEGGSVLPGSSSMTVNAWADFEITSQSTGEVVFRVVVGDEPFIERNRTPECLRFVRDSSPYKLYKLIIDGSFHQRIQGLTRDPASFVSSDFPSVIYLPTDRTLAIPDPPFKPIGDIEAPRDFFYKFKPATKWDESLGALLQGARWADLNAKEEGHPEEATHFESYSRAFQAFFGEAKRLVWEEGGKLFVKIAATGERHALMDLGSGEKQALILAAELYRRWRPGSLILIDEPELHFHSSWQTVLWSMLEAITCSALVSRVPRSCSARISNEHEREGRERAAPGDRSGPSGSPEAYSDLPRSPKRCVDLLRAHRRAGAASRDP